MAFQHWITLEDAELHLLWEAGLIELTSVRRAMSLSSENVPLTVQ
jgi:hypothetical protein